MAAKVYDFDRRKVEGILVSHLRSRQRESTVADLVAGTGLPKYQVEQGLKAVHHGVLGAVVIGARPAREVPGKAGDDAAALVGERAGQSLPGIFQETPG